MAIIMNEFLPVPNIAPSSYILLHNNLSYVICIMFFFVDPGHANILRQQQLAYMGCGCSHSSVNKFLGILMNNNKSPGHMENGFLHFDTLPFQNTQNAN